MGVGKVLNCSREVDGTIFVQACAYFKFLNGSVVVDVTSNINGK